MAFRPEQIDAPLGRLDGLLEGLALSAAVKPAVQRWRGDAAALRFHLRPRDTAKPLLLAVIGGTGTGKSTLVNRLLGMDVSATSFRRTFTTGSIVIARDVADVPRGWLGVEHVPAGPSALPARGQTGSLLIVAGAALGKDLDNESILNSAVLVDTPDLDGDQPAHHLEADRAFRWAQGLVFLVTPEKYQMTELLPYYRLAARYATPALYVMNKCEEQVVVEDYRAQLQAMNGDGNSEQRVYVIPRDDAAYDPPAAENLPSLRGAIAQMRTTPAGLANRAADLAGRLEDQVLSPLRQERREADRLVAALRDMETPAPGIDVNPVTEDLERRLQQRSVLYLMGPQRVLDRVRQAPQMLVRLPRVAWDYVMRGSISAAALNPSDNRDTRQVPDFRAVLADQFAVLQSRIDDLLRTSPAMQKSIAAGGRAYEQARISPSSAGLIADEELAELRSWLEKRWNATPRDTRAVQSLLKFLPGGSKLTGLTEAAPYLLAVALIAHHAMFGMDLVVLGGYSIATWLTERLSNEVAAHTRATNARIAERFTRLAHEQIQKMCAWINQQAVANRALEQLERTAGEFAAAAGVGGDG